jgi:hypothetical protein
MAAPIVYWWAVTETCTVLIAAPDLLPALKERAGVADGEVLTFADTEALRALEAITKRRPRAVAVERLFAATPRGAALINRIKADASLAHTEIRVLAHDSDYSRVLPRAAASSSHPAPAIPSPAPAPAPAPAQPMATLAVEIEPATATTATLEPPALDRGTRRAPRFRMAGKMDVLLDGNPATLTELSTCGAQVVSPTVLKPNQRVRMVLSDEGGVVRFNAAIAWAAFEMPPTIGPQYRAGVEFLDADAASVDAFCTRHREGTRG